MLSTVNFSISFALDIYNLIKYKERFCLRDESLPEIASQSIIVFSASSFGSRCDVHVSSIFEASEYLKGQISLPENPYDIPYEKRSMIFVSNPDVISRCD